MRIPDENQIVFVHGGVAQYRDGKFYTGMDDPRYARPIQWDVRWWYPIDADPYPPEARAKLKREAISAIAQKMAREIEYHWVEWEESKEYPNPLNVYLAKVLSGGEA